MQVNLGDKIWMNFGPNALVVGYILEASPDNSLIAVGPMPYHNYIDLTLAEKSQVPASWFRTDFCHYLHHIPREEIEAEDEKLKRRAGFIK